MIYGWFFINSVLADFEWWYVYFHGSSSLHVLYLVNYTESTCLTTKCQRLTAEDSVQCALEILRITVG